MKNISNYIIFFFFGKIKQRVSRGFAVSLLILFFSFFGKVEAQCPEGEVVLSSQMDVNNFLVNYPSCTELTSLIIVGSGITNLSPLSNITSVSGGVYISNISATSLNGLHNLITVGGTLDINNNPALQSVDLPVLQSSGFLKISNNDQLQSLAGLSGLVSVGGIIHIDENNALTDIKGLKNIDPTTIGGSEGLYIVNNTSLSVCNLPNFCTYLQGTGNRTISGNAGNCISEQAVEDACSAACSGDITFSTQAEIDSFVSDHSYCENTAFYNFTISGADITNLDGLSGLTNIAGELNILNNPLLTDIDGLSSLQSIGLGFYFSGNPGIQNIDGLSSLETVGGYVDFAGNSSLENISGLSSLTSIGSYILFMNNNSLENLNGIHNLTEINGQVMIVGNGSLTDISGLQNIDPSTIDGSYQGLIIANNPMLSVCNLSNFCTYLANPGNTREIYGNAGFCLDEQAVEAACVPCPSGNIGLYYQQDIDDFGTMYAHCTNITVNTVNINGNITNLDGLSNIKTITGNLYITSTQLTNIDGLSGLQEVNAVQISDNFSLTDISLNEITNGSRFRIFGNPVLTDISLSALTNVSTFFEIYDNSSLTDIGLNALTNITYDFEIYNNNQLTNLDGLSALTSVGNNFEIHNNNQLTNISGLSALTSVENLTISSNPQLTSISLNGLTDVLYDFEIHNNTQLTDISGLSALTNIGHSLIITDNTALSVCNILPFCDYFSEYNLGAVSGNAAGCDDSQAIENACAAACTTLGDFTFTTQAEIDAFGTTYDHCPAITLGNLTISGNDITNLEGLSYITGIVGNLTIEFTQLTDLDDLPALQSIGGSLTIKDNASLTNINALSDITGVGGLTIQGNASLTNINGLSGLAGTVEFILIDDNASLTTINDLSGLTGTESFVNIQQNPLLENLDGLSNLTSIGGQADSQILISENAILNDILGLQHIDPTTITGSLGLYITNNPALSVCNLSNFCTYLSNPSETHPRTISGNLANCLDETAVTTACSAPCPTSSDNFYFSSQAQIDDFGITYFHCTDITVGDVTISGSGITNLDGLSGLKNVTGYFKLQNINTLTNTDGLSNLTTVGDYLEISSITSTSVALNLSGLTAVGEYIHIQDNNALTAIDLSGLTSVDEELRIQNNSALTAVNLNGLTNSPAYISIDQNNALANLDVSNLTTIGGLSIHNSPALPNLNTLSGLTTVGSGGLSINSNNALTDINGLSSLTTVEGGLGIVSIPSLTHLDALSNLTTLGGMLEIAGCSQLTNLDGLSGLTSTGGINLNANPALTDIDGLSNITTLGGYLRINDVDALTNLDGLNGLTSIGGRIEITRNALLTNLNGLSNVQSVQGEIRIGGFSASLGNPQLTDISGLANIDPEGITNLYIRHNPLLNVCNLPNFCEYLSNPVETHPRTISENAGNCLDEDAVTNACAVDCNITGNVVFNTQAQIDAFTATYIHCTNITIDGYLTISGNDITDLSGLSNLTAITQELWIGSNDHLTNLDGLNNLQTIGGYLRIYNHQQLNNLDGLASLQSIGGYLEIQENDVLEDINGLNNLQSIGDYLMIYINPQLANLDGLSHLTSIGTELHINTNDVLTDISGLQNIDPATIGGTLGLYIKHNPLLSVCNLPNFCEYLSNPANPRTISDNFANCLDETAVKTACAGSCGSYKVWDGNSWITGEPGLGEKVFITGEYNPTADLEVCELEVAGTGKLTIPANVAVTVNGKITNNSGEENFIVETNGNLIQTSAFTGANSGNITVRRNSTPMMRLDYALWSSPVDGQGIHAFSLETVSSRIYTYEGETGYQLVPDLESDFIAGKGYMFRAPNNWNLITDANGGNPVAYPGEFVGVPFNGDVNINVYPESYTSVGNPYSSNLKLGSIGEAGTDTFLGANQEVGTIYYWTNTNPADGAGGYTGNNWATYTLAGGTSASGGNLVPEEIIAPGQGFIIRSIGSGTSVNFNNTMRTSDEALFFKNNEEEISRFWLNLKGDNSQSYNQILIGYLDGATEGVDHQVDGKMFGYEGSAIFNFIDEDKFTIQGRPLPFETADVVPLGFIADSGGKFIISLNGYEGIFAEGGITIYVKDNVLGVIHNLMESDYEFESVAGKFTERFEIIYEDEAIMGTDELASEEIQIYKDKDYIIIDSKTEKILSVELYDLNGRDLYREENINAKHYQIKSDYLGSQVLVVKVQTKNGEIQTKKLINN